MSVLSQVIQDEHMQRITSEFSRLGDRCYLENAGATLYPQSLITLVSEDLSRNIYMNPHSDKYTRDCIEQIRSSILKHFNTDPANYTVIFTSGCTQSLKKVLECFQFSQTSDECNSGSFVYLQDNHTSCVGLREIALEKNADIIHISHDDFLTAVSQKTKSNDKNNKNDCNTLFVYPAQSNFNGYKYPLNSINRIKNGCLNSLVKKHLCKINCNWYVLLDVASFVPSNKLDLSKNQPDFVTLSFYKIFGYPTGLGALLVKNMSENVLCEKKYFGGGTVDVVLTSEDFHIKRSDLCERLEDGTGSFLSILALKHCFDTMYKLIPKIINNDVMDTISHHVFFLGKDLHHQLLELRHQNGGKAAILYMDSDFTDIKIQGGVVTFNLMREDGSYIGYAEFQHMADLFSINVRTGCFCNSGSCQRHLKATNKELKDMFKAGHKCGDEVDLINGRPTGAIRVSLGYFNTFKDIDKLMHMINKCFVKTRIKKPNRMTLSFHNTQSIKQFRAITNGDINKFYKQPNYYEHDYTAKANQSGIQLKEIVIYPVKSCGALKVKTAWKVGLKGFEYDREWMIVKDNGVCLTQKQNTRMALIQPKINYKQKLLFLNFKGKTSISIPLDIPATRLRETNICQSKVCSDTIKGYDCGDEVANWISEALEISFLRLIRQSNNDGRLQKKKNDSGTLKSPLSLSNQAPYLLINKATVRWLRDKIKEASFTDDVGKLTDRFRGNLIVDMDFELAERDWVKVIIGNHEFKVEGQCARCQMVCIDQHTGERTVEPLRTISEQFSGKLRFGIYLSYVGTVDNTRDRILQVNSPVQAIVNDDDISR